MLQNKKISSEYFITQKPNGLEITLAKQNPNPKDVDVFYIDALDRFQVSLLDGKLPYLGTAKLTYQKGELIQIQFKGDERLWKKVNMHKENDKEIEASEEERIKFLDEFVRISIGLPK